MVANNKKKAAKKSVGAGAVVGSKTVDRVIPALLGPALLVSSKSKNKNKNKDSKNHKNKLSEVSTVDYLSGKELVGIYFAGASSSASQAFTPKLIDLYNKVQQQQEQEQEQADEKNNSKINKNSKKNNSKKDSLEIVLVSSDDTQATFLDHFEPMPWAAVQSHDIECVTRKKELVDVFKAFRIPTLIILHVPTGNFVSEFGWKQVSDAQKKNEDAAVANADNALLTLVEQWKDAPQVKIKDATIGQSGLFFAITFFMQNPVYAAILVSLLLFTPVIQKIIDKPLYIVAIFYFVKKWTAPKGERILPYNIYHDIDTVDADADGTGGTDDNNNNKED